MAGSGRWWGRGPQRSIHRTRDAPAPELCLILSSRHNEGRRSADRRIQPLSAPRNQMLPPECVPGAEAGSSEPARLSALHRGLAPATERRDSAQAALHAIGRTQALPAPSFALKRCTSRTGRNAGRVDARTARERGYKPRPQEPHSPHQSAVTGDVPRWARFAGCNGNGDGCQGVCRCRGDGFLPSLIVTAGLDPAVHAEQRPRFGKGKLSLPRQPSAR